VGSRTRAHAQGYVRVHPCQFRDAFGGSVVSENEDGMEKLARCFGVTPEELRAKIKPVFMFMYEHKIDSITIERNGTKANISVSKVWAAE
jgi:hypothetical protein